MIESRRILSQMIFLNKCERVVIVIKRLIRKESGRIKRTFIPTDIYEEGEGLSSMLFDVG